MQADPDLPSYDQVTTGPNEGNVDPGTDWLDSPPVYLIEQSSNPITQPTVNSRVPLRFVWYSTELIIH